MNPTLRPDPYDPFSNPTQHRAYASHYRTILPQIGLPGYQVPLKPTKQERKRIRHYFNAAGFGLTAHFFLVQILALVVMAVLQGIMGFVKNGVDANTYIQQSSILMAVNGILFLMANTSVAAIGCRVTKIPIRNLFHTNTFRFSEILPYLFIGIFIQSASGNVSTWITDLLGQGGITAYEPDIDYYGTGTAVVAEILYGCLIAPITEEFLYRGFVLKNLSRVSQRTGILLSAFLFGLGHQNISQFLLAVRHNSILPSIFVHVTVNSAASIFGMGYERITDPEAASMFAVYGNILYTLLAVIGAILLVLHLRKHIFPKNTPAQSLRGGRILCTAPWLLVIILLNLAVAVEAIWSASV